MTIQKKIVDMLKKVNFKLTFTDPNIKKTLPMVKKVFNEEHPSNLYKCNDSFLNERTISGCKNDNDNGNSNESENNEMIYSPEWNEFIQTIWIDHFQNVKWIYLTHDFLILILVKIFLKLQEMVEKVFNPATLFPQLDKIPNADGHFLRLLSITKCEEDYYTLEQWESCTEFETVTGGQSVSLNGLKYWILSQYRNVCRAYPTINCDALYMNENYIKN
ncbi:hypothetical protein H8356DRAFT_1436548 [Neocallimastix lanati (nom. inval.)]|nr:hypothetical protein H8356DRAFT_1436548 [Neocallimastix sp. JGI-2020a]